MTLKVMASNIGLYGAFLHNYARATDTVRRCSAHSTQFGEITKDIRLRGFPKGPGLSLEDLLHKPVARVQKNALVLHVNISLHYIINIYIYIYINKYRCTYIFSINKWIDCENDVEMYLVSFYLILVRTDNSVSIDYRIFLSTRQ